MLLKTSIGPQYIRRFEEADIPEVAELHRKVFGTAPEASAELQDAYRRWLADVFLSRYPYGDELSSLVSFEGTRVTGFLGSVSRRMVWRGEHVLARISSQFIVDPASRGLAGVNLLRKFLAGPQDLSVADESNGDSRRLWTALGGATSLLHSMQWIYPIRPFRSALWAVKKRYRHAAPLAMIVSPFAALTDGLLARIGGNPFRPGVPGVVGEKLEIGSLLDCLREFASSRSLHAQYDIQSLEWLLDHAAEENGAIRSVVVKSAANLPVGCYIYRLSRDGISEVLQLYAVERFEAPVLALLAHDAAGAGALALRGRCEPGFAGAIEALRWPCHWGPWVLVQSRRPGLSESFQRGDAFFSRLDGEWCLRFRPTSGPRRVRIVPVSTTDKQTRNRCTNGIHNGKGNTTAAGDR
jgi:hypothetical protein